MSESKNTYTLTKAERQHISEVKAQLQAFEEDNLKLEGTIRRNEREQSMMRRHLALYLGQMATANKLPMGSKLSADNAQLRAPADPEAKTAPAAAASEDNNGVAS